MTFIKRGNAGRDSGYSAKLKLHGNAQGGGIRLTGPTGAPFAFTEIVLDGKTYTTNSDGRVYPANLTAGQSYPAVITHSVFGKQNITIKV